MAVPGHDVHGTLHVDGDAAVKPLTPSQERVAHLSIDGYSLREIARILRISFSAAKSRRMQAREKMGVRCIRDATLDDLVRAKAGTPQPLAKRQIEVLQGLAEGKTYEQIAQGLGLKTPTVKNHIHATLKKLNAANANQAIAEAFRRGVLE